MRRAVLITILLYLAFPATAFSAMAYDLIDLGSGLAVGTLQVSHEFNCATSKGEATFNFIADPNWYFSSISIIVVPWSGAGNPYVNIPLTQKGDPNMRSNYAQSESYKPKVNSATFTSPLSGAWCDSEQYLTVTAAVTASNQTIHKRVTAWSFAEDPNGGYFPSGKSAYVIYPVATQ